MIPKKFNKPMHPADIQASLLKANCTQASIANDLEVDASLVSRVISDKATSIRVAEHIAEKIGKPVERIWPKYKQSA